MKATWLSWVVGVAMLGAVVVVATHLSDAESFGRLLEQVDTGWLAAALGSQALTYVAQGQIWRRVIRAAGGFLPLREAYWLSLVKLFVDQALPSSGISGALVVSEALRRRGIGDDIAVAGMVISASAYLLAYAVALGVGLATLGMQGSASAPMIAGGALFMVAALVTAGAAIRFSGRQTRSAEWLHRLLDVLGRARPSLARNPRLLMEATALQLLIVAFDCLTLWALVRSLGTPAPLSAVFVSFMVSTLLRTISIVPGGLGTFEAASVVTLHAAGVELPVALSATLLFRGLSFWLPMLPGLMLSRGLLRHSARGLPGTAIPSAYWSQEAEAVINKLGASPSGLSPSEAALRLQRTDAAPEDRLSVGAWRLFLRQFQSPLVLILVFGAAVSLFLEDWVEAAIILAIVLGSSVLGFMQEFRAGAAIASLRRGLALTAQVLRDGVQQTVPASSVVPGDVVVLSAGNLVPGDGLVIEANDFMVSEAPLTGESFPVEKRPGVLPENTPLARRSNCVYLGTSVRSGIAKVLIVRTGRGTELGAISARIATQPQETEFARGTRHFGNILMRTMVMMVLFVITVNQVLDRPVLESLLFAVALAVGLTPELLPAIVSVTLSRGAREMAKQGVLVRRLDAIEDLGGIDVLCTDKTGTLTEGVISLDAAVDAEGRSSQEIVRLAYLNAVLETGLANPLDAAIVAAAKGANLTRAGARKIDEIPYDFTRKRLSIVIDDGDPAGHLMITKGAFDNVLSVCAVDAEQRGRFEAYYRTTSKKGFRVLALATRRLVPRSRYGYDDEQGLSVAGFLLFRDPTKSGVTDAIQGLAALGIRIKVITGDNRYVAARVAVEIGLNPDSLLTGERLDELKDEALWHLVPRTDLFVEVDPQQKERIVRVLQRTGHVVGYLGDGINDAPALHAADAGISVQGAADVARESADVVLTSRDLAVLRRGVEEGRGTFANTLKYISITTSANFGNMVSMAVATPFLPFLPLLAKQILLNNFLSDLPSMAIATDRVDSDRLAQPQRWNLAEVRRFMIVFGLLSTAFDLLAFFVLLRGFGVNARTFQTAWFVVSLLTELAVLLVLRTRGPCWRSRPGVLLLWTTAVVALAALVFPYAGAVGALFGFVPLSASLLGMTLAIVVGYVLATEAVKLWFFGMRRRA